MLKILLERDRLTE